MPPWWNWHTHIDIIFFIKRGVVLMVKVKHTFYSKEYKVSDTGIVYGKSGKPLKPSINPNGYQIVVFTINGKQKGFSVHNLVARAFVKGYKKGLQVNHKDGNKLNNNASNLEWCTPLENVRHSIEVLGFNKRGKNHPKARAIVGFHKLTGEKLYEFDCLSDAARYFGSCRSSIWRALNGDRKTFKKCVWKYK